MNNNDENEEEFAAGSNAVGSEPITDEHHQQAGDTTLSSSKYDFDNGMLLDLCNDQLILLFLSFSWPLIHFHEPLAREFHFYDPYKSVIIC